MYLLNKMRKGIAMIELIFSIVVIGITLLSIPNLLSTSSSSSLAILQQEGIAMAASHTNALMTYAWDEKNTNTLGLYMSNKLHVGSAGDDLLDQAGIPTLTYFANRKRTFDGILANASAIGDDTNATLVDTEDDVDDFNGIDKSTIKATIGGATSNAYDGEYIDINVTQATTVRYAADDATYDSLNGVFTFTDPFVAAVPANETNIKTITTLLTSNALDAELQEKQIALKAFMCNIGAASPSILGNF